MGYAILDANNQWTGDWARNDNPPRPLLEGESVVQVEFDESAQAPIGYSKPLAKLRAAKQLELDSWWSSHPGVAITLPDESVRMIPVQKESVTLNRVAILEASITASDATVFDALGLPLTIPIESVQEIAATAAAAIEVELQKYYAWQVQIQAASTASELGEIVIA